MANPYRIAFLIPAAFVLLCLVKKLTVIGIIGKIQGIKSAAKPPRKAKKKIVHRLFSSFLGVELFEFFTGATVCFVVSESVVSTESVFFAAESITVSVVSKTFNSGKLNFKLASVCTHFPSIQACPSTLTSTIFNFELMILIRCVNFAVF